MPFVKKNPQKRLLEFRELKDLQPGDIYMVSDGRQNPYYIEIKEVKSEPATVVIDYETYGANVTYTKRMWVYKKPGAENTKYRIYDITEQWTWTENAEDLYEAGEHRKGIHGKVILLRNRKQRLFFTECIERLCADAVKVKGRKAMSKVITIRLHDYLLFEFKVDFYEADEAHRMFKDYDAAIGCYIVSTKPILNYE